MMRTTIILLVAALAATVPSRAAELASPDGRIDVSVTVDDQGIPRYSASFDGNLIVAESRLGLRFREQHALTAAFASPTSKRRA